MKKINGFTITKLTMTGFKCYEDTVSFNFGDTTFITSSNGQGKSSIADAITFAFVGTPFFGDKGLDRLQNKNTSEMSITVDFVDDSNEAHSLTRTRRNDITTISFDGFNIRQSDITSIFGDKDTILSILNPLYFINVLGDSGKSLLEKLLRPVSHEEVLAALPKYSQEILSKQSIPSPETFIKNRRGELKKLEETLIGYKSQKELLDYQRDERAAAINEIQKTINANTVEMSELLDIRDKNRNPAEDKATLEKLRKRKTALLSDAAHNGTDNVLQGILKEIKTVESSITKNDAAQYSSSYTTQIAKAEVELKVLYDEHDKIKAALTNTVVGYKCPTCMCLVTDKNIQSVKSDLQRRLDTLVSDGKTAKNRLTELKNQDSSAKNKFEETKAAEQTVNQNKLNALNQQLQEINVAHELDAEDYEEQLAAIENQIKEQERLLAEGNLSSEQILRLAELEKEDKESKIKIKTLHGITDFDYASLITQTETEITQLKQLINEAIQYMAKRIELMLGDLKMSNTEIVLTEVIKTTGEIKDCFRFSYDGRDYKCLSLSEKVRAGLEITTLIQRLSGRNYPIFVDNGESICTFGNVNLSSQVIIARVVNNQSLQVSYKNRNKLKMAA